MGGTLSIGSSKNRPFNLDKKSKVVKGDLERTYSEESQYSTQNLEATEDEQNNIDVASWQKQMVVQLS
jgi:hypothetical protein